MFLVTFNLLAIPLYIAIYTSFTFQPLQELNAQLLYLTMELLGYDVSLDGSSVYLLSESESKRIDVSWDSTGWKSMYAIAALIIATPMSTLSRKIKPVLLGIGAVFVLNYLRITTTVLVSANFGFDLFDIIHTFLWREGLILAVVAFWLLWFRRENYKIGKSK